MIFGGSMPFVSDWRTVPLRDQTAGMAAAQASTPGSGGALAIGQLHDPVQGSTVFAVNCSNAPAGAPGMLYTFSLHGDAMAPAGLAIGDTAGSTTIPIGQLGSLQLGLAQPFLLTFLGFTNAAGDVTLPVRTRTNAPGMDLFAQGFTVTFTPPPNLALSFCTSNVVSFHIGT